MANCEGSTVTVSSQSAKQEKETLLDSFDESFDLSLAIRITDTSKWIPTHEALTDAGIAHQVTPHMIEQANLLARFVGLDIEFRCPPDGGDKRKRQAFADVFKMLLFHAEGVLEDWDMGRLGN